ncbi:YidB family protein [Falsirhodobacter sp. 1013]|uniref:YidB family protein n=1 Tax=Falsirhodobacter sp. 1013 TaxID=3417566 RepID=UPI003EBE092C
MGLLDQVLGGVMNSRGMGGQTGSSSSPLLPILMALLSNRGGQGGGLGGLLGGMAGGGGQFGGGAQGAGLNGGLGGLIDMFTQAGHGDAARSWVSSGQNQPIGPHEVETAFGGQTIDRLSQQTGLQRGDLLSQLSAILPEAVDKLTPNGRLPDEHETRHW